MNTKSKRVGLGSAVLIGSSLLLVPALRSSAGSLPDPATVPCQAYGADADCPPFASGEMPTCAVSNVTPNEKDVLEARLLADLVAHATQF